MYVGKPWPIAWLIRIGVLVGIALVALRRRLGAPRWIMFPGPLRRVDLHWTDDMVRQFLRSFGSRLPMDQPCELHFPNACPGDIPLGKRRAEQIKSFYENGFLEPFSVCSAEQAHRLRASLLQARQRPSAIYGFPTDRDRHFDVSEMLDLMASPPITDKLSMLLGPDLWCWRSQIFCKDPGAGVIQWHQATTYMLEDNFIQPVLIPSDRNVLFQLTVWIALTPATSENGCLRFVPGTHRRIQNIRLGGETGFYAANYRLEYRISDDMIRTIEMEPGQALIFSERTIHGSGPNETDQPRIAFNYRVVGPDVQIYPQTKRRHRAVHMAETYDLSRWRAVRLRGDTRSDAVTKHSTRLPPT